METFRVGGNLGNHLPFQKDLIVWKLGKHVTLGASQNFEVSEGLNSVETEYFYQTVVYLCVQFQKDLIVWKH